MPAPHSLDLHDHLGFAAYRMGNLDLAIESSYTVLTVDPDNYRVQDNVEWYEYELEHLPVEAARPVTKKDKTGQRWTARATCLSEFSLVCGVHFFSRRLPRRQPPPLSPPHTSLTNLPL